MKYTAHTIGESDYISYKLPSDRLSLFRRLVNRWMVSAPARTLQLFTCLKLLGQMEPNLAGSIYVRSSIKHLHLVPFGQQTWPLLLNIEHMVKLHVFGNNSKTINNIRNLTGGGGGGGKWSAQQDLTTLKFWRKSDYLSWELLPVFHQIFKILILFVFYFKNYKR